MNENSFPLMQTLISTNYVDFQSDNEFNLTSSMAISPNVTSQSFQEFAELEKKNFVTEREQREELDQMLVHLHDSYKMLLAKYAEAENTIDKLRLGKSLQVENLQNVCGDYPKNLHDVVHNFNTYNPLKSRHNYSTNGTINECGNQCVDNYCQTDLCFEMVNEPFCSSVAKFLLCANCLSEQVNSLHNSIVDGILTDPDIVDQMMEYLWDSYCSLDKDERTHQCHSASLEEIALGDVRNLLIKIHSQLISIESLNPNEPQTHQFVAKNFSCLQAMSSYGSLGRSPTASNNSLPSEHRGSFFSGSSDSGISDRAELKSRVDSSCSVSVKNFQKIVDIPRIAPNKHRYDVDVITPKLNSFEIVTNCDKLDGNNSLEEVSKCYTNAFHELLDFNHVRCDSELPSDDQLTNNSSSCIVENNNYEDTTDRIMFENLKKEIQLLRNELLEQKLRGFEYLDEQIEQIPSTVSDINIVKVVTKEQSQTKIFWQNNYYQEGDEHPNLDSSAKSELSIPNKTDTEYQTIFGTQAANANIKFKTLLKNSKSSLSPNITLKDECVESKDEPANTDSNEKTSEETYMEKQSELVQITNQRKSRSVNKGTDNNLVKEKNDLHQWKYGCDKINVKHEAEASISNPKVKTATKRNEKCSMVKEKFLKYGNINLELPEIVKYSVFKKPSTDHCFSDCTAATALTSQRGYDASTTSSSTNDNIKKIEFIQALNLANKIAKELKNHSIQMLKSFNTDGNIIYE